MSAGNFLGVILSDEVAVATEESKEPFRRQQSPQPRGYTVISRSYRGPSTRYARSG
jgi:hypothetical protein